MGIFLKDINLRGKTALITGATKGLGRGAAIAIAEAGGNVIACLLYTSPSPRDLSTSRMPSSA